MRRNKYRLSWLALAESTDARNKTITATYDHLNRLTFRNYSDSAMPDVEFYYDGKGLGSVPNHSKGKLTRVSSSVSDTRYTSFDNMGRLLTHQQITDGQTYSTAYSYNLSGALIEETYPSTRKVKTTLSQDGEVSMVQSKKNSNKGYFTYALGLAYDSAGSLTKMRMGNGHWETYSYNERLQVKQIGLGKVDTAQDLLKLEFRYTTTTSTTDNNGSMKEQKITIPTGGGNNGFTATQTYTYDNLNRLESAAEVISGTQSWKQTFSYDRFGNRRFDANNTTTLGSCTQAVCNPLISTADNRFSSGQGYSYDAGGNLTQDAQGKRFGYDSENRQNQFFTASNSSSTPDATYYYDGGGRRVKKITSTETTVFVYNAGGKLVAEYSTELATTPQVSYLTADHLGSARIITNERGVITGRKDYTAFGEEIVTSQRSAPNRTDYTDLDEIRQGYTGYEKDTESGLEYAQARYYNSGHGRYTSVDPLTASASTRNPQSFNRYSYVLNSPYKFTDPLGLLPITVACGQTCPNSGDYVDGSAFSGTDSPFKKEFDDMKAQRQQPPPPPPPPTAEQNADNSSTEESQDSSQAIKEATNPTDIVDLDNGESGIKINLPKNILEALENDAIALGNLMGDLERQGNTVLEAILLVAKETGVTFKKIDGKFVIVTDDMSRSGGGQAGGVSGSATITANNNLSSIVQSYNETVDKINQKFTEGKTAFQINKAFRKTVSPIGGKTPRGVRNIKITSNYLGALYTNRIGAIIGR